MNISKWEANKRSYLINIGITLCIIAVFTILIQNHRINNEYHTEAPIAQKGIINLKGWDFSNPIKLNENWAFYHTQLLESKDFQNSEITPSGYVSIDKLWNTINLDGKPLPVNGYATYRLIIEHDERLPQLALFVYTFQSSSKVYMNGKLISQNGKVGTNAENSSPLYLPKTIVLETEGATTELIVQVCDFYSHKGGGNKPIILGTAETLIKEKDQRDNVTGFISGGLIVLGLFFMGMFLFWMNNKSVLYFSLFCLGFGYWLISSFYYLIFTYLPFLSFEFVRCTEFLAMYCFTYFSLAFFVEIFPDKVSLIVLKVYRVIAISFAIIVLFTPHHIYGNINKLHNLATFLGLIYMLVKGGVVMVQNRPYSGFLFAGNILLMCSGIYKVMVFWRYIEEISLFYESTLLLYILSQGLILAHKIALSFKQEQLLTLQTQEQASELAAQTEELATQAEELTVTNDMLNAQKQALESINHKMTANINAASNIQGAILPELDTLIHTVGDAFVIWQPKDIVGGDFYWFKSYNNKTIVAAIDCTGHGVSGALMSISASHILKETCNDLKIYNPDKILETMNKKLIEQFAQDKAKNQASMDASICVIDHSKEQILFAGARNPLVYIQNDELLQIKGDRKSLGTDDNPEIKFSLHTIDINTPISFYLFSDGYQDQFGGPDNRKFGSKRMKKYFKDYDNLSMSDQKDILFKAFTDWKGQQSQIDDIMIIGVYLTPKGLKNNEEL